MKQYLQFLFIRINRFILKRKYIRIMDGPLKGLKWTSSMNYEYLTGTYIGDDEKEVIINKLNKPGAVFYDIGANIGYFSIAVKKMLPTCTVIAFEPIPQHLANFKKHVQINNIGDIEIHDAAVTDATKDLVFSNLQNSEGNTYKNESENFKNAKDTLHVKGVSVDDFVASTAKVPTILKIDVEGAELDVLNGAVHTINKYKPVIMLATHDCHVPGIKEKCLEFLKTANYTATIIGAHNKHVQGLEDFLALPNAH